MSKRAWRIDLKGATDLGTDVGRVYGRCELAEHYGVDLTDLPGEMFALRRSLRLYPWPAGAADR
jgi:hypothetical protein